MADSTSTDSPLEAAAGAAGPRAIEAFSNLGNETRLSILLALWEAYEPFAEENALSFSELRERVGMTDSGQFNYHLDKLAGHFISKTDDGYELRRSGQELVRTVISGTGITESSFERTKIDDDCTLCGGQTAITYHDEFLYHICTQCDGYFGESEWHPRGVLSAYVLDPAGLANRRPEDLIHAAATTGYQTFESALEGVCDRCSAEIEQSLDICPDHASEGLCDNCGRHPAIITRFVCPVCKINHQAPPFILVAHHPAVIAFYYERGVTIQYEVDGFKQERRRRRLLKAHEQSVIGEDPLRIVVMIEYEGDELRMILDEELNVIEVEESS